jgi:hypothetical protein
MDFVDKLTQKSPLKATFWELMIMAFFGQLIGFSVLILKIKTIADLDDDS